MGVRYRLLRSCLGLREDREVTLLETLSLSWTNEPTEGRESPQRSKNLQRPSPIVTFMREIIATTGAYRDMEISLPKELGCKHTEEYEQVIPLFSLPYCLSC